MKLGLRNIYLLLSAVRFFPAALVYFLWSSKIRRNIIDADVRRWASIRRNSLPRSDWKLVNLARLLTFVPEFRNLFYHRLGHAGRVLALFARPLASLYIYTLDIGPGLYIQHGVCTIISARRIGRDCWVNQGVTLGYSNDIDCPTIGNDVTISAGAKVIGAVTIGDRAKVGANAVVIKDVPADATAVGVPARVVKINGQRVPNS